MAFDAFLWMLLSLNPFAPPFGGKRSKDSILQLARSRSASHNQLTLSVNRFQPRRKSNLFSFVQKARLPAGLSGFCNLVYVTSILMFISLDLPGCLNPACIAGVLHLRPARLDTYRSLHATPQTWLCHELS